MNWLELSGLDQLESIKDLSHDSQISGVLIFKHSARCAISAMALNRLERDWDDDKSVPAYFLNLLEFRNVSNAIVEKFGVIHESPQVLVIKDGTCVYSASHNSITVKNIYRALK